MGITIFLKALIVYYKEFEIVCGYTKFIPTKMKIK